MGFFLPSARPDSKRGLAENVPLCLRWQRQCPERVQRFFNVAHPRSRPVATEQRLVRDLWQARKVLEQVRRGNAADVEINIGMAAHEEGGGVQPERPASMC